MGLSVPLNFRGGKTLLTPVDLLLTFDRQAMQGMYTIYNPVVWRVTSFPAGGGGSFDATYDPHLAFTRAQVKDGIVQSAEYFTHIDLQQKTTLTMNNDITPPTYHFSQPVPWQGTQIGQFECTNHTGEFQNIGIGFFQKDHAVPDNSLVLNNVPGNTSVPATFTPILSAYVVTGYQKNQIIQTQIQSSLNWHKDLALPGLHLDWVLEESNDGYTLVPGVPAK